MNRLFFFLLAFWISAKVKCDGTNETEISREPKILNDFENFDVIKDLFDKGFVRYPLAVVIDLSAESLDKVKNLWGKYENNLPDREIILSTFDVSGLRSTIPCRSRSEFYKNLKSLRPFYNDNASVEKTDTFTPVMEAILESLPRIPFDSAVLVLTGNKPKDQELGPLVEESLIRRRCRLYVVWTGEKKSNNNFILKDISEHVGGKLSHISDLNQPDNIQSPSNQEITHKKILLGKKDGIAGFSELDFVVNETYSKVDVKVGGRVSMARLKNPKGEFIDLKTRDDQYVLYYSIKPEPEDLGLWILETDQESFMESYGVVVLAEIPVYIYEGADSYENDTQFSSPILKAESSVLEKKPAQVRFPEDDTTTTFRTTTSTTSIIETFRKSKPNITINTAAAAQQNSINGLSVPIIVEVSSGTTLEARPGSILQVNFDVKNNMNLPTFVDFFQTCDNCILTNIPPPQTLLQPGETRTVQISVSSLPNLGGGGTGTVTLTARPRGLNRGIARSAMIYFTQASIRDTWDPKIRYKYQGDCKNYDEPKTCENGQWSFEATVHDEDSGLLRVMSEPFGLIFSSEFIAGTRSPVYVTYTASCCQEKVDIWAEDLKGNYVRRSLDVFHQGLLAGEIAAIVVGVLLLIIIIIVIIVAIVLCRRRNKVKLELPRHRAGSR